MNFAGLGFSVAASGLPQTQAAFGGLAKSITTVTDATDANAKASVAWTESSKSVDAYTTQIEAAAVSSAQWSDTLTAQAEQADALAQSMASMSEKFEDVEGTAKKADRTVRSGFGAKVSKLFSVLGDGAKALGGRFLSLGRSLTEWSWNKVKDGAEYVGTLATNAARFVASMPRAALDGALRGMQAVGGAAASLSDRLSSMPTGTLTTDREAELQHIAEGVRRVGVNYGFTGQALRQFTSQAAGLADSLAVGPEEAARAVRGFQEATSEFRAIGVRNAADVARIQSVFGVQADVLRNGLLQLRNELGFNDRSLNRLMGSVQAYGQQSGDVAGALGALPTLLQQLREQANATGRQLSGDELEQYGSGVMRLARGFFQLTQDSTQAREMAESFSRSMIDSQRGMQNMIAGTESDLPGFVERFAIAQGDISTIMSDMQSGPDGFIRAMARVAQSVRREGGPQLEERFAALRSQLEQAVGSEQAAMLTNFFRRADDATLRTMTSMEGATSSLASAAREGFSTGRTLSDEFTRMQQGFLMGFRNIGRAATATFVTDTGRAFSEFNASLRGVVARGGPMADLVTLMSEASHIGASAFLPRTLRPMLPLFNNLKDNLKPFTETLGALGINLQMLASPFGLVVGLAAGAGLWFSRLYQRTGSVSGALNEMGNTLSSVGDKLLEWGGIAAASAEKLTARAARWVASVDWASVFQSAGRMIVRGLTSALTALRGVGVAFAEGLGGQIVGPQATTRLGRILGNLAGLVTPIVRGLLSALGSVNWASLGAQVGSLGAGLSAALLTALHALPVDRIGGALVSVAQAAFDVLVAYLPVALRNVTGLAVGLTDWLMGALERAFRAAAQPQVWTRLLNGLQGGLSVVLRSLTETVLPGIASIIGRVAASLPGLMSSATSALLEVARQLPARLGVLLSDLGGSLQRALPGITATLLTAAGNVARGLFRVVGQVVSAIPGLVVQIGPFIVGAANALKGAVLGVLDGIRQWLVGRFPESAGRITAVFGTIRTVIETVVSVAQAWLNGLWVVVTMGVQGVVGAVQLAWAGITAGAAWAWGVLSAGATTAFSYLSAGWQWISSAASSTWTWIRDNFLSPVMVGFDTAGRWLREHFGGPIAWVREQFTTALTWITEKIALFQGALQRLRQFGSSSSSTPSTPAPPSSTPPPGGPQRAPAVSDGSTQSATDSAAAALRGLGTQAELTFGSLPARASAATTQAAQAAQSAFTAIPAAASTATNGMVSAFATARDAIVASIGTVRSAVVDTFGAMRTSMLTFQSELVAWRDAFVVETSASFASLFTTAGELFRTNVLAVVRAGMTETFAAVDTQVQSTLTTVSSSIGLALDDAISGTVARAFLSVLRMTEQTFTPRMVALWDTLAKRIGDVWAARMTSILTVTETVMAYVTAQTATMLRDLATATSSMTSMALRTPALAAQQQAAESQRAASLRTATPVELALLEATHNPDWAERYMELFAAKMDRLIAAQAPVARGSRPANGPDRATVDRQLAALSGVR